MKAVLGIGTNIGDRKKNIENAVSSLNLLAKTKVCEISRVYETQPWGYKEQPSFYNCAVLVETELSAGALLGACLGIEAGMGRIREFKNGPRIIDIDILLIENFKSSGEELTVPHKFILQRDFVLIPLHDLFPENIAFGFDFSTAFESADRSKIEVIL